MKTIILNDYSIGGRLCDSCKCRKREHDECSLDSSPGFEADVIFPPLTTEYTVFQIQNPRDSGKRRTARMESSEEVK